MVTEEEIIQVVDDFINEYGLWSKFVDFVEEKGYTVEELGFPKNE